MKIFKLRKAYIYILSIYILIIYILRGIILFNNPELFALKRHFFIINKEFSLEQLPLGWLGIFIIYLYIIGLFLPKKIYLQESKNLKILELFFSIQCIILIILGPKIIMGTKITLIMQITVGIITSIISNDFLFFLIIYNRILGKKKIIYFVILYIIPTILKGSKAGIFISVMMILFIKIGLNNFKNKGKYILLSLIIYFLYPIIYSVSWLVRGKKLQEILNLKLEYSLTKPIYLISHRMSGLDILQMNYEKIREIEKLDFFYFMYNILRGIIPSGIMSIIFSKRNIGYGRFFAEVVYGQPQNYINGYEATLFGVFYYNSARIMTFLFFNIILILIIKILTQSKKFYVQFILIYFVYNFINIVVSGNYDRFLQPIRFGIMLLLLLMLLKKYRMEGEK